MRNQSAAAALAVAGLLIAGCSSSHHPSAAPTTSVSTSTSTAPVAVNSAPVWLCQPGVSPDPCAHSETADVVSASGARTTQAGPAPKAATFDCFYVYPTVSGEPGPNADLRIQPPETSVADQQASRFSSVCQVWAPMYRQVTVSALYTGGIRALNTAYASLLSSWKYYLQYENQGRPIVLIGHSQGAAMLIRLISEQIDPNPILRNRIVVAIMAGGNVQVASGKTVGGSFRNMPLCTSSTKAGCVIAYSTFASPPPSSALFGVPGQGVSLMSLQFASTGQQVACVNPAALSGGSGELAPYFLDEKSGRWITYPGLYAGSCQSAGGATWLQVTATKTAGDSRPVVHADLGPDWGLHIYDVNLPLGNLVSDVSALEAAYRA